LQKKITQKNLSEFAEATSVFHEDMLMKDNVDFSNYSKIKQASLGLGTYRQTSYGKEMWQCLNLELARPLPGGSVPFCREKTLFFWQLEPARGLLSVHGYDQKRKKTFASLK